MLKTIFIPLELVSVQLLLIALPESQEISAGSFGTLVNYFFIIFHSASINNCLIVPYKKEFVYI